MAGSINKVILVGNLGRDPEVRFSQDGNKIVNMSLATSESWTDRSSGERREKTEWHRVVIFNDRLAEVAEKYLNKGSKVYLEGQLQTRKWTGNDGVEKYTTEVVLNRFRGELTMLDSRSGAGGGFQKEKRRIWDARRELPTTCVEGVGCMRGRGYPVEGVDASTSKYGKVRCEGLGGRRRGGRGGAAACGRERRGRRRVWHVGPLGMNCVYIWCGDACALEGEKPPD